MTLDIDLVLTRARILALDTMMNLTLITILLITTVIDLDMTNIITKTPRNHSLLLHVHIMVLPLLVVHLNNILVLVNVPLVIITPPLNDAILLTALLPNHVKISIVVDHIQIQKNYSQFQYKPSINLTHPFTPPLHSNPSTEPKFEINMYQPTTFASQYSSFSTEHANAITPSTWFANLYIFKPSEDTSLPTKLELLILLDSGASICVLNLPTFTILADHFLKCSKHSPHKDECVTLAVANETEVPNLYNVILTLHTSIPGSTRTLVILYCSSKHQI